MERGKVRWIMVSVFLLLAGSASPQFSDSVHYHFKFVGTGNINNTDAGTAYIFNNAVNFDIDKKFLSFNATAGWIFGENNSNLTNNDFTTFIDAELFKEIRKLYYWGLAGYDKSYSLKIDDRLQTGVGLGYNLIDKPKATLVITDGVLYETTDFRQPDQHGRETYQTLRNSFRIKFRFVIKDFFTVEGTDFLQNSLNDAEDYIIRSNTALSIRLYKWLGFTIGITYNKLNLTDSENFLLNYGLTMEKFF